MSFQHELIQTSGGWVRFVCFLNHDNVDDVGLDKLPRRRQFGMIGAIRECRAFANDDLSTATEASVDSELCIDLTVLRHPTLHFEHSIACSAHVRLGLKATTLQSII